MKDIKWVMIGFLLATSMFLFMGQTKATNSEIGRYQAFANDKYEYMIDTSTGELWDFEWSNSRGYYWDKEIKEELNDK